MTRAGRNLLLRFDPCLNLATLQTPVARSIRHGVVEVIRSWAFRDHLFDPREFMAPWTGGTLPSGKVSLGGGVARQTITVNVAGETTVEPEASIATITRYSSLPDGW